MSLCLAEATLGLLHWQVFGILTRLQRPGSKASHRVSFPLLFDYSGYKFDLFIFLPMSVYWLTVPFYLLIGLKVVLLGLSKRFSFSHFPRQCRHTFLREYTYRRSPAGYPRVRFICAPCISAYGFELQAEVGLNQISTHVLGLVVV